MQSTVTVGERTFSLGKPPVKLYLRLIQLLTGLYVRGSHAALRKLRSAAEAFAGAEASQLDVLVEALLLLEEDDILRLSALLLHLDEREGVAFVQEAGWDLGWFAAALAANAEQINLGEIVANFQRLGEAVSKQLAQQKPGQAA